MKRAVGGTSYFASQSPAVLVARALRGSLDAKGGAASQYTSNRRCEPPNPPDLNSTASNPS